MLCYTNGESEEHIFQGLATIAQLVKVTVCHTLWHRLEAHLYLEK